MRPALALLVAAAGVATAGCAATRPDTAPARRAIARELMLQGKPSHAFLVVDELVRDVPRDALALTLRGTLYRDQHLHAEAEGDLKEALRLRRKLPEAHAALAVLYEDQERLAEALEHHRRAAELEPRNPAYLNNLGFALFVRGRHREAVPVLEQALRAAPTDARIRNNLGFAWAASGELSRAAEQFAMAGSPAEAKNNLAFAYERRGAPAQAFDLYAEAIRLDPSFETARRNLARVARQAGRELPADLPSPPRTAGDPP